MKNLWCCNFLIFQTILINDVSNKIVINGLQFELTSLKKQKTIDMLLNLFPVTILFSENYRVCR
jgi:hypothetical protein